MTRVAAICCMEKSKSRQMPTTEGGEGKWGGVTLPREDWPLSSLLLHYHTLLHPSTRRPTRGRDTRSAACGSKPPTITNRRNPSLVTIKPCKANVSNNSCSATSKRSEEEQQQQEALQDMEDHHQFSACVSIKNKSSTRNGQQQTNKTVLQSKSNKTNPSRVPHVLSVQLPQARRSAKILVDSDITEMNYHKMEPEPHTKKKKK